MTKTLKTPQRYELSLANVDSTARNVTWYSDDGDSGVLALNFERDYDIVYPWPTFADLRDYAPDLAKGRRNGRLPEALEEKFQESEGYGDWRAGFDPMMNYVWPVMLAYQVDESTAAELIAEYAPTCTLISFTDEDIIGAEHGIALSGGGMNLSDQLVIAYLCCGCVPPARLLSGLRGVIGRDTLKRVRAPLRQAYRRAAEFYASQAKSLREESRRIFAKPQPRNAE